MPLCGFNVKMVQGIALFAEGLFEATMERATEQGVPAADAFQHELRDIQRFLQALEEKHQELKRHSSPEDVAAGVAGFAFSWRPPVE